MCPGALDGLGPVRLSSLQRKDPEQHLLECRLRPMTYSWLAAAAKVCNPPILWKNDVLQTQKVMV